MSFKNLMDRVSEGEVVPVENINNLPPELFISKNWNHFQHLTIENDLIAGVHWIYDRNVRQNKEYNP